MNKNNITGIVLIALLIIGYGWYTQPSEEEIKAQQEQLAKQEEAKKKTEKAFKDAEKAKQEAAKAKILEDTTALFHSALNGKAQTVTLHNDKIELTLNTKGATVEKAVIKNYVGHNIQVKDGSKDQDKVT